MNKLGWEIILLKLSLVFILLNIFFFVIISIIISGDKMYILLVFIVISIFVIYVVIDNRRIKVKRQEINLGNTGKSIKILQISDLHSKVLRNADYIKINALKYDVVAYCLDNVTHNIGEGWYNKDDVKVLVK